MLLAVEGLNTYYGESHALRDFSLSIGEGEIVALLGRNGMGKSTALKSIMGLVKPRSGRVVLRGADLAGSAPFRMARAGVGYVPEERRIFPNLSVLDNLSIGIKSGAPAAASAHSASKTWTLERIYEHFPFMRERAAQRGRLLSGGEQQMLAIARTLMGNPDVLLVDEPTEGLAPLMVKEVRDVLAEINKAGVAIVVVEHNLKVAMSLAHRVYLMGKAHVGFAGTVAELQAQPEIRARYLEV
jgi:branched-chain amino acid transport system ATP-binding protein